MSRTTASTRWSHRLGAGRYFRKNRAQRTELGRGAVQLGTARLRNKLTDPKSTGLCSAVRKEARSDRSAG